MKYYYRFTYLTLMGLLMGCSPGGQDIGGSTLGSSPFSPAPSNLRIQLTDAPIRSATNVFVNVKRMELLLAKDGNEARIALAENTGVVDLLTLRNGITMKMGDLNIPAGVEAKEIRLI